jgi:hypothetical protein
MHAAMNIGVLGLLIVHQAINHWLRHLARGCVIEINQRFARNLDTEYGEIGAYRGDIQS